jgi:LuxR family transcriptional activator of conjugal transfer of Ti plasmids
MHSIFQSFIDGLANSTDAASLRATMVTAATRLDVPCFAYLALPGRPRGMPQLISTYPSAWTAHYLKQHYERFDPVIVVALQATEPFEWGMGTVRTATPIQRQLFEEASRFGIRCGFTIPIHDPRGPVAAVTFASDARHGAFSHAIERQSRILQLMAMYFHAHARRTLAPDRIVDGVSLSPREHECLAWAARGKTAWEIGRILGVSRRTAAFHLENAKAKLGVHSICQAVARLAASKPLGN